MGESNGERIGHCRRSAYTFPSLTAGSARYAVAALEDKIPARARREAGGWVRPYPPPPDVHSPRVHARIF